MLASTPPPHQTPRLAERLAAAQRRNFVGRQTEVEIFRRAVLDRESSCTVLHIHGPGGVGKTSLLREYLHIAAEMNVAVTLIDGRNVEPSPAAFLLALRRQTGLDADLSDLDTLSAVPNGVLLIDTYEALAALDGWLRESLLPQLPMQMLVVIAGRNPPTDAWRMHPGWRELTRVCSLRNLRPDESQTYLIARQIPETHHETVLQFTHGHPLALSLVADILAQGNSLETFIPEHEPDVVRVLLERFVQQVPDTLHQRALEVCAHVRVTTEDLLAEIIGADRAPTLFAWLRGLSFIEQGADGLYPHDLARDVLELDLRWRAPDRFRQLHEKVRSPVVRRFQESSGLEQQHAFFDLLFLHRNNPVMKPFFDWNALGAIYAAPATTGDHDDILKMVEHHEGVASARIAAHWLARQPDAFTVLRDRRNELTGFVCTLALHQPTPEDLEIDPATQAAWTYARRHGPIRTDEEMLIHRFHMARDTYQEQSPAMDMTAMISTTHWLTNTRLAWTFIAMVEPGYWSPMFSYLHLRRAEEADYIVGDRSYGVFSHDWRVEPGDIWLQRMGSQEIATSPTVNTPEPATGAPLVVLSLPEFEAAVRQALRDYTQAEALAVNPLLRSRLVADFAGDRADPAALQAVIRAAAATLEVHPRDAKLFRAIHRTYLKPAPTQEQAAEILDLPFSTYRYHLNAGIKRMTSWMWQREINGPNN